MKKVLSLVLSLVITCSLVADEFTTTKIEDKVAKASGNLTTNGNTVSVHMTKFTMFNTNRVKADTCANYLKREQGVKTVTSFEYNPNAPARVALGLGLSSSGTSSSLDSCQATGTK